VTAALWQAIGEAFVFALAGAATIWSKRSANKTDSGNAQLVGIRMALEDLGRKVDRVDDKLDRHLSDHAWRPWGQSHGKD